MDTEDVRDAITLLEDVVNSKIFDAQKIKIKPEKIIKNIKSHKSNDRQYGGNKFSSESSESSRSAESITNDSMTVGDINIPSEIFVVYKKDNKAGLTDSHNNSHYNLAFSSYSKNSKSDTSDFEKITNLKKSE
jgi:hypothetical protein